VPYRLMLRMPRLFALAAVFTLAILAAAPASVLAATFQPEVLLMRSVKDGAEKSFDHAKLKPVTTAGRLESAVFRYRAETDTVTCTVKPAPANASGATSTTIVIQRETLDPDGNKNLTTTSQVFVFTPGKSLIVSTAPHLGPGPRDNSVEILQLTLVK